MDSGANNTSSTLGFGSGSTRSQNSSPFGAVAPNSAFPFGNNASFTGFANASSNSPVTASGLTSSSVCTHTSIRPPMNTAGNPFAPFLLNFSQSPLLPTTSTITTTPTPASAPDAATPGFFEGLMSTADASSTAQTASCPTFILNPPSSPSPFCWSNVRFPAVQTTSTVSTTPAPISNLNSSASFTPPPTLSVQPASASSSAAPIIELLNGLFIAPMATAAAPTSNLPLSGLFIAPMAVPRLNSQPTPAPSATQNSLCFPSSHAPTQEGENGGEALINSISAVPKYSAKCHEELRRSFYESNGGNRSRFAPVKAEPGTDIPSYGLDISSGKAITIAIQGLNISVQI